MCNRTETLPLKNYLIYMTNESSELETDDRFFAANFKLTNGSVKSERYQIVL